MTIKQQISTEERAQKCALLALDKKGLDVKILDIRGLSTIADYLVLASGTSDKQVIAIADSIRTGLKKYGKAIDIEGARDGKWIVIDYGDVIVHAFVQDLRNYYDLDDLWSAAPLLDIPAEMPMDDSAE